VVTRSRWRPFLLLLVGLTLLGAVWAAEGLPRPTRLADVPAPAPTRIGPAPRVTSGFKNLDPGYKRASFWLRAESLIRGGTWLVPEKRVVALPLGTPDPQMLRENTGRPTVTWVGHSTVLVQLDGVTFLTDPTWAQRSGPFGGRVGVGRYTPPGIRFEDLPRIDFVLISHDHYDHLDEPTVERLARTFNPRFIVPLGIKDWLADRGITNAVDLNWGESVILKGLTIVCVPAQHGSGRTLLDQGRRLWASWVVLGSQRFYFAGDTGYNGHFKDIGDTFGPFDLAALPIGSYTPKHIAAPVHISPEEAIQATVDLRATRMIGIHWGTFGLAREAYDEPPKRLAAEVARRQLDAQAISVLKPGQTVPW
jgi:L-ascorbate metabolism protein UlaG (beta-lactamase superfamily)